MNKLVSEVSYTLNPSMNRGEQVVFTAKLYDNGDDELNIYMNQEITLYSYTNSVTLNLFGGAISPDSLRELANLLDKEIAKHSK